MARNLCPVGENESEVMRELPLACQDETAAVELMERQRWGDCPACPRCGDTDVYPMRSNDGGRHAGFRWRCRGCEKQCCERRYSVRTGTVNRET